MSQSPDKPSRYIHRLMIGGHLFQEHEAYDMKLPPKVEIPIPIRQKPLEGMMAILTLIFAYSSMERKGDTAVVTYRLWDASIDDTLSWDEVVADV